MRKRSRSVESLKPTLAGRLSVWGHSNRAELGGSSQPRSAGADSQSRSTLLEEIEFIKFTFPLKNGISHIKLYDSAGVITYESKSGEVLKTLEFDEYNVSELNGSFKKAFKQIRELDRQNASTAQSTKPTIDRSSFGLAEVN